MDEKIQKAADKLYQLSENEEERMVAEARAKYWSDYNSEMHSQREIGKAEGREEGLEEGRKEGRAEVTEELIRSMDSQGLDHEIIAKITKLSAEELSKLKKI